MESKYQNLSSKFIWSGFFIWVSILPLTFMLAFDDHSKASFIESVGTWSGLILIFIGLYIKRKAKKNSNSSVVFDNTSVPIDTTAGQINEDIVDGSVKKYNRLNTILKSGILFWIFIFFPFTLSLDFNSTLSRIIDYILVTYILILPVSFICIISAHLYRQKNISKATFILKIPFYYLIFSIIFLITLQFLIEIKVVDPCGRKCQSIKNFNKEMDEFRLH